MLTAGDLVDRVSIEVRTETDDGHRGTTETWAVRHHRWSARVRELSGRDLERARQVEPRTAMEVDFRYWQAFRADLDGGRIRLKVHPTDHATEDRTLEVVGPPVETERRLRVTVPCREAA
jgi:head-tail adaptor